MKTTLSIDDTVMHRLKREAARQRRTMSEIVEAALRMFFKKSHRSSPAPEMPAFDLGGERVDVADRDALYRTMEEE